MTMTTWQSALSAKYFDTTFNYTTAEIDKFIFTPGKLYRLNKPRLREYQDMFHLEVYDPEIHEKNHSNIIPTKTIELLLLYSIYNTPKKNIDTNFLCLGSYLGDEGNIDLFQGGEIRSINRIWHTKFLIGETIAVFRWYENPKVLKAYYNHPLRKTKKIKLKDFGLYFYNPPYALTSHGKRYTHLTTTTIRSFLDHKYFLPI